MYWFTKSPVKLCEDLSIEIEPKRAKELEDLFDGNVNGWYYLASSSDGTDESAKWILGPIAAKLNELKQDSRHLQQIVPADYLKDFISYLKAERFPRSFAKDVFGELMGQGQQLEEHSEEHWLKLIESSEIAQLQQILDLYHDDQFWCQRKTGQEVLNKILESPRFKAADSGEMDTIIDQVIADNVDKVAQVHTQPKLLQYLIGQVMKASKGKAIPQIVQEKLKIKLGIIDTI